MFFFVNYIYVNVVVILVDICIEGRELIVGVVYDDVNVFIGMGS